MTGNVGLENVPPSLELVRISNHALKGMIEANSWKNRSKLFQGSEILWAKTSKTLYQIFQLFVSLFSGIFCTFHAAKILLNFFNYFLNLIKVCLYKLHVSVRLSEGLLLDYLVLNFRNKISYYSLLYRLLSLSFRLIKLLWDNGW